MSLVANNVTKKVPTTSVYYDSAHHGHSIQYTAQYSTHRPLEYLTEKPLSFKLLPSNKLFSLIIHTVAVVSETKNPCETWKVLETWESWKHGSLGNMESWKHACFGNTKVLETCMFWKHGSLGNIHVLETWNLGNMHVLETWKS